jgi:hypothetical protein
LQKIGSIILKKEKVIMKRMMLLLAFCGMLTAAMADWTYGTARFFGSQPSSCLNHGGVMSLLDLRALCVITMVWNAGVHGNFRSF